MNNKLKPFKLSTNGQGLWSRAKKEVTCLGYEFVDSQLRIYFDTDSWSVKEDNLIYTDPLFLAEAKVYFLKTLNLNLDFDYSESGMQGEDYVDFDINPADYKCLLDPKWLEEVDDE